MIARLKTYTNEIKHKLDVRRIKLIDAFEIDEGVAILLQV